ncbi:uncharacterized protein LOC134649885 [Cydia amplana]|uniref:uncharacterized protein LOC134649885 n=1 Tax=Cydia amplana TaxID=1869771 RepID=UPI002FE5F9F7
MSTNATTLLSSIYPCVKCQVCYQGYKQLLEHLYWRHGTESVWCSCGLKRWVYADHQCNVLPIDDDDDESVSSEDSQYYSERETEFCYCGRNIASPMIGCDGPQCALQWYHFSCVGITIPPFGDWLCPDCCKQSVIQKSNKDKILQT